MNTEKFTPEALFELLKKHDVLRQMDRHWNITPRQFREKVTALLSDLPITALKEERDALKAEVEKKENECKLLGSAMDKLRIQWSEEAQGYRRRIDELRTSPVVVEVTQTDIETCPHIAGTLTEIQAIHIKQYLNGWLRQRAQKGTSLGQSILDKVRAEMVNCTKEEREALQKELLQFVGESNPCDGQDKPAVEWEEVKSFIKWITLELQSHRSRTPEQLDAMFQASYRLYVDLDVENRRHVCPVGGQTVHISTIDGQSIEEWKQNCDLLRSREAEQSRTVNRAREELTAAKAALAQAETKLVAAIVQTQSITWDSQQRKIDALKAELSALSWHNIHTDPPKAEDADRNGNVEWLVESGDTFSSPWDQQIADLLQSTPVDGLPLKFWRPTNLPSIQPAPVEDFDSWLIKHNFPVSERLKLPLREQLYAYWSSASRAQKGGES